MKITKIVILAALLAVGAACGGYSSKATPAVAGTMPAIAELAPGSMNAGSPAFVLTVNGTNFSSNASINWNGTAQTTTYVSGNQMMTKIPASAVAAAGTVPVTVTNPGTTGTGMYGSGGTLAETSAPMNFTIN